jgi:hypothetical protein
VGSKTFGGLNRRLKEKTAESRWFATTGQAPFGRAKAAYWKININSELRQAYRTTLEAQLQAHPEQVAVVKLLGPVLDAVQAVVEHKLEVFGAAGKRVL